MIRRLRQVRPHTKTGKNHPGPQKPPKKEKSVSEQQGMAWTEQVLLEWRNRSGLRTPGVRGLMFKLSQLKTILVRCKTSSLGFRETYVWGAQGRIPTGLEYNDFCHRYQLGKSSAFEHMNT